MNSPYFRIVILFLNPILLIVLYAGSLPEYEVNYKLLLNRSIYQTHSFIAQTISLPKIVNANPFISIWPFPGHNDNASKLCIVWCPRKGNITY